ncbi:MAG: stage II sporulation protein M [Chloroflexi bacterium]|nr:MAG: stage II sporulation protein M [Chloroflexota bacterium]
MDVKLMDANQLYQAHQADWKALTDLIARAERDIRRLTPAEIDSLGRLYRAVSSDLALAQRDFPRHPVAAYLNQLVARGHAVIYRPEPLVTNRIKEFIVSGFPRVYREMLPFTVTAALLFWVPALLALAAVWLQPDASRWLLPAQVQDLRETVEQGKLWMDIPVAERPYTSAFIMRNNIQVAFMAFAGGITAGLLTVWSMVMNGLVLGGLTGLTAHYGLGWDLWTFVIGHGVIELSVIMMAGGAGLMLAWAMIHPGLLRRLDALKIAANQAVRLVIGCVPLLVLAGTFEGFLSPATDIAWPVKWAVGLGSGVALYS